MIIKLDVNIRKAENIKALYEFLAILGNSEDNPVNKMEKTKVIPGLDITKTPVEKPVKKKTPPKKKESSGIKIEDLRFHSMELIKAEPSNKMKIKEKVTELGADNISNVKEEKYTEFQEFLNTL